ncbi:T9SS type A sorting domain-containing protein [Flavobacterium sp.]|uniref:T9SS type A sorting domain-containing protein n=1 Tax=Flavobacterium sp. TaxID=239 RepID=UPI0025C407D1|nr:T9SS type A sorting domain-containing protein [Flavobacterium sp.]MBA4153514.1 hypothetical protein [Flavobacterium sp.]
MKKNLFLLLFMCSLVSSAQSFEWIQTPPINFNSSPSLIGYTTTCDAFGNIYVTGFSNNSYNYTDIFGDLFYNKYSVSGELLFSKTFTGKGQVYAIQSDSSGNTYLAVSYIQSITIDETTLSTSNQGVQPVLLKFDANGTLVWHIDITSFDSSMDYFKSIAIDNADAIYICYDNYYYSYVKKLDTNGNVLLTIEQQYVNIVSSVSVDDEGYIYTAGACANSNSKYANVTVPAPFSYSTYVAKYSPTGVFQWVKYVEDITCSQPQVIAKSQEEVYFSSTLHGPYTFDSITAEGPTGNGYDFFLAKLNSAGFFQWVKEVPDGGRAFIGERNFLSLDVSGNIYLAGSTSGTVNWGNNIITTSTIYQDAMVLKYDSNGTILMAKTAGGADTDRFDGVTTNDSGDIFLSGIVRGTSNFDDIQHVEENQYKFYPVLAKIDYSNLNTTSFFEPTTLVYPNPTRDYFYIQEAKTNSKAAIYTILGKKIKEVELNTSPISIVELASGTYFLKLENGKTFKLVKL